MSSRWTVTHSNGEIVIQDANKNKIVIETMISSKTPSKINLELKRKSDLEKRKISSIINILVPHNFSELEENRLKDKILQSNDYEYVVYAPERYPLEGLIKGTIHNIGFSAMVTLIPAKQIVEYMSPIHYCMNVIENVVQEIDNQAKAKIAKLLNQPEDIQTWRMAGLILSNAMVFYDLISDKITLQDGKNCKTLDSLHNRKKFITKKDLMLVWQNVLDYNYNPIFSVAINILSALGMSESTKIIDALYTSSKKIREKRVAGSSDMYGKLLQKVIVDRSNLASYYTRPEAAALMAKLAVPDVNHPIYEVGSVSKYRIVDFACGTGLLLSSAYRQLLFNYEASHTVGKKMPITSLHKTLIENCFVGLDVLPIATHLTVSSLAMMFPTEVFGKTKVKTMPIGLQHTETVYVKKRGIKRKVKKEINHYRLGSLDLISNDTNATLTHSIEVITGKETNVKNAKPWSIEESHHLIGDGSCDLIVMNPPFVRSTNDAKKYRGNAVPKYAAFGSTKKDQSNMGKLESKKFAGTCSHGHAGLASNFIAICDKKIHEHGTMTLIMPATIASGKTWSNVRKLLKYNYDIKVISIARPKIRSNERSFSSDTGMAEIILVAKKRANKKDSRGLFVSLRERPSSMIDAIQIGTAINNLQGVDRLETGHGGTKLRIGEYTVGNCLDCSIHDVWKFVNVVDPVVEQLTYKIRQTMVPLKLCFEIGPGDRDITGGNMQGPFNGYAHDGNPKYTALWNNVQKQQTKLIVPPDQKLKPKSDATDEHIDSIWKTASIVHMNIGPDFTSNSLIAAYVSKKSVGGRVWPSIIMDRKYEKPFVAWCNSSIGVLCFWSLAGKQQLGRGAMSRTNIQDLPIPDFTKMNKTTLGVLSDIFDRFCNMELDRMKNLWKDKVRIAMDKEIVNVMGMNIELDDIRVRFCMEPSISGGKPESILTKKHEEIIE